MHIVGHTIGIAMVSHTFHMPTIIITMNVDKVKLTIVWLASSLLTAQTPSSSLYIETHEGVATKEMVIETKACTSEFRFF